MRQHDCWECGCISKAKAMWTSMFALLGGLILGFTFPH